MNLSQFQRVKKLGFNLLIHPKLILPYVRTNLLLRSSPIELKYAWWSFLAIEEVDKLIADREIFEYGLGGSTVRWSALASNWKGVEHDSEWLGVVKRVLPPETETHIELQLSNYRFKQEDGSFEESDYLFSLDRSYDGILIDGMDVTGNERICCFYHAEKFVKKEGFIVVDDFWRYEALLKKHSAKRVQVLESVGPCRFGVTSTAIFHY